MNLLICIAHHYTKNTFPLLCNVLDTIILTYKCQYKIVIQTNTEESLSALKEQLKRYASLLKEQKCSIDVIIYTDLNHPYLLTWQHRQYILDHANEYDTFMYIEDDLVINYEQFTNYLDNFKHLWPNYVPSFLRYEVDPNNHKQYVPDYDRQIVIETNNVFKIHNKTFYRLKNHYSACWICPKSILQEYLTSDFLFNAIKMPDGCIRERAASFVNWYMGRDILVQTEDGQCSNLSLIHHSSNNTRRANRPPEIPPEFGTIPVESLFVVNS